MCLLQSCTIISLKEFPCSSQKLPSGGAWYMSVSMTMLHLSFIQWLSSHHSLSSLCHVTSISFSVQNSLAFLFDSVWKYHSSLLSYYVSYYTRLDTRRNCPCTTHSILAVRLVTVASVAVIERVTHYLSLPKYSGILSLHHSEAHSL
jgi:hypothetical protein